MATCSVARGECGQPFRSHCVTVMVRLVVIVNETVAVLLSACLFYYDFGGFRQRFIRFAGSGGEGHGQNSQIRISRYEGCENRKFSAHSKSNFVFVPSPKIMNAACCPNYLPAPSPIIISILQNLSFGQFY